MSRSFPRAPGSLFPRKPPAGSGVPPARDGWVLLHAPSAAMRQFRPLRQHWGQCSALGGSGGERGGHGPARQGGPGAGCHLPAPLHKHTYMCMQQCMHTARTHMHTHAHKHPCTYVHVETHVFIHTGTQTHTCACTHRYMHLCVFMHPHACRHTHIHTCMRSWMPPKDTDTLMRAHTHTHPGTHTHIYPCTPMHTHTQSPVPTPMTPRHRRGHGGAPAAPLAGGRIAAGCPLRQDTGTSHRDHGTGAATGAQEHPPSGGKAPHPRSVHGLGAG